MAEPVKIKFDYKDPENVEAEVPGAQKIRESLSNETGEILPNNAENEANNTKNGTNDGENASNYAESTSNDAENALKYAESTSNDAENGTNNAENASNYAESTSNDAENASSYAESTSNDAENGANDAESTSNDAEDSNEISENTELVTSQAVPSEIDGVVITRHRRYFSGKRNGIHGEPVMLEKHLENVKAKTKIPISRFRQTVEKVKEERRSKKEHESHIPVRRTSNPKIVKDQKIPIKKQITITKIETTSDPEPITTKTVITKELNEPASSNTDIITDAIEPEDEFDKIYAEIVDSTPTEEILDDTLLNPKVDDPEKVEIKFEEIIHDYDEHKIEPINVEVIKRSKIPYLKRKSQHETELSAQSERTSKIIAARDKLRLRNSSTKNDDFEKELDEELNTQEADDANDKAPSKTDTKTEKEISHEIITSPNSITEIKREFSKTISTTSLEENKNSDSIHVVETTTIKEETSNEIKDLKENKQYITEENVVKDSIRIGIPVFDSHIHEFSENNESTKTVEVTRILSYTSTSDDLSITKNISEIKQAPIITDNSFEINSENNESNNISENNDIDTNQEINHTIPEIKQENNTNLNNISEITQEVTDTESVSEIVEKANDFDLASKTDEAVEISENNNTKTVTEINKFKTKEQYAMKNDESINNDIQLRGKVERIISKIDSKEIIETDKNQRESINELKKKKSVMSKIAMFEQKEIEKPFPNRNLKKESKLPKLITKDWQKVERVHVHTPLIVDEVFKPFHTNITINDKDNKAENSIKSTDGLKTIVVEKVTVQGPDTVHYATENKVQIETKTLEHNVIDEILPQAKGDSEYTVQKVEIATITEVPSRSSENDNNESTSYKNEVKDRTTTKLSMTKELQSPVTIPGFKPVSELLKSFEDKNEASKNTLKRVPSKVEYRSTVIESPLRKSEIISTNQNVQSEISTNQKAAIEILRSESIRSFNTETYDDFVSDFKSLDDVFTRDDDFKVRKNDDEIRRAKSLAELDIGDAVKGKVGNIIMRMTSVDKMDLEKKEIIKRKEMPRKRSVSEKIALFEGLTPSRTENQSLKIFKCDKLTEVTRTEKKIENSPSRIEIKKYRTEIQREKSVAEKTENAYQESERSEKNDEEVIQKKIEELRNAKIKYGKVENMPEIELSNGVKMPVVAIGTALLDSRLIYDIVSAAIDLGYRAIDTAFIYGNEKEVGEAIRAKIADGTVKREDLFIISKLWSTYHRTDLVEIACNASLKTMGLDYFDLYLIHNPMSFKEGGAAIPKIATVIQYSEYDYLDAWFGMETLVTKGLVRAIGVSNFNSVQLQRVLDKGRIKPVVNQVECHPYLSQQRLDLFCSERNVTLSCFGILGSKGTPMEFKNGQPAVIDDPLVKVMASGLGITPAQLLISYQLENGHGVVVKASSADHLWDNLQALNTHLTMGQVDALNALNRNKRMFAFRGMGDTHKNYPFNIAF